MAAPALRNTIYSETEDYEFESDDFEREEFFAGERICPPRPRRGAIFKLFVFTFILGSLGGGWVLLKDPPAWLEQISADVAALGAALDTKSAQAPQPEVAAAEAAAAIPQPVEESVVPDAPAVEAGEPVPGTENAAETPEVGSEGTEQNPTEGTPAPKLERTDPYEKKAEAVGLNPNVSRMLLKKMSADDYRNAGVAIKTALAETPDDAVFTYPRERKAGVAHFQVHFVQGAAENCRRYVVTISQERWETTSLPMEKCGVSPPKRSANKAPTG